MVLARQKKRAGGLQPEGGADSGKNAGSDVWCVDDCSEQKKLHADSEVGSSDVACLFVCQIGLTTLPEMVFFYRKLVRKKSRRAYCVDRSHHSIYICSVYYRSRDVVACVIGGMKAI